MKTISTCLAVTGFLAASACSSVPALPSIPALLSFPGLASEAPAAAAPSSESSAADPAAERTPRERVARAVDLLGAGKEAEARTELQAALAQTPRDATAQLLLRQIETDPVTLLGEPGGTYVVQAGDTMSGLADRFLGDGLMFYALSRYNGLAAPNALSVGRTLKAPATAKATTTATLTALPEPAAPVVIAAGRVDTAKANAVRLQALQLLNTGDVLRAVTLLKEAVTLDQTDPAIRRDLDRALRIQAALKAG